MSDVICAVDLVKNFRNVPVLDGLNLTVPEGSVFGLAGPNGAGKTTTIKILMNILRPSSGQAQVLGHDSRALGPDTLANIGYVSENQALPEWMTVRYLLAYLKPFYPGWDNASGAATDPAIRSAARSPASPSLARHADEDGSRILARVSSAPADHG